MKNLARVLLTLVLVIGSANGQWQKDKNYAGATVGLSGVGSTFTLGADYERGVYDFAGGIGGIGVGALFNYWTYNFSTILG